MTPRTSERRRLDTDIHFNVTGWLGYLLFAAIGTLLFTYAFLPTVGGLTGCLGTVPLFCGSMYLLFHFPLGVAGYFVFSHVYGARNIRIYLVLLLVLGGLAVSCFNGPVGSHWTVPSSVVQQPVPFFVNVGDYYPYAYWVSPPLNVSYTTAVLDEYYVFEFAFFWPFHPVSFPSTCGAVIPTNDWELVYVYVDVGTQQVGGVAYRYHCQWTFVDRSSGLQLVNVPGIYNINGTRPTITFISNYHIPVNDIPGGPKTKALVSTGAVDFAGSFNYIQQDYNYSYVSNIAPQASPIDPAFFRGFNWPNVELLTGVGIAVWGVFVFIFTFERRYLAGTRT